MCENVIPFLSVGRFAHAQLNSKVNVLLTMIINWMTVEKINDI